MKEEVADEVAGLPTGDQKWVRRSLRKLAQALSKRGHSISRMTVRRLLKKLDYRLVSNRKSLTGEAPPDRDRQFRYIKRIKQLFLQAGLPVISVDTKNKELLGNFHHKGRKRKRSTYTISQKTQLDEQCLTAFTIYLIIKATFMSALLTTHRSLRLTPWLSGGVTLTAHALSEKIPYLSCVTRAAVTIAGNGCGNSKYKSS